MSAIRPLATIAMLMVLGYFLWTRINAPGLEQATETELALEGVAPLDLGLGDDAAAEAGAPPAFMPTPPAEKSEAKANGKPEAIASAPLAPTSIVPLDADGSTAMPELPPLPVSVPSAPAPSTTPPAGTITGSVPSLGTEVPPAPIALPEPADVDEPSAEMVDSALAGTPDMDPTDTYPPMDEFPSTEPANPEVATSASREFAAESSAFAAARPEIEEALNTGKIEEAHRLLSQWYGDRSLTSEEQQEVEGLLAQLAGTVIYSNEHRLEAPHRVAPGETLETIAQKYNVPWQLLAKINGVPQPSAVTPGQELKVLRGPFFAVVDVERQQLALMVAERYAGRFSVKTEGQATTEGEWVITQKQMPAAPGATSKQIVLEPVGGQVGGPQLVIGPPSDSSPVTAGAIRVAPTDQEDLFDILSIGSRVIIRR